MMLKILGVIALLLPTFALAASTSCGLPDPKLFIPNEPNSSVTSQDLLGKPMWGTYTWEGEFGTVTGFVGAQIDNQNIAWCTYNVLTSSGNQIVSLYDGPRVTPPNTSAWKNPTGPQPDPSVPGVTAWCVSESPSACPYVLMVGGK